MMDATVAGTAITVDLGAGNNLPLANAAVIICAMEQVNVVVIGNDCVAILAAAGAAESDIVIESSVPAELLHINLPANTSYIWSTELGTTNPLAGATTATIWCGHNYTTGALVVAGALLHN